MDVFPTSLVTPATTILGIFNLHDYNHFLFKLVYFWEILNVFSEIIWISFMETDGLVIVYTGKGKGKTTAALGIALRATGYKKKICMIQFIKGSWHYG